MKYQTILIKEIPGGITIIFNRVSQRNSINAAFIKELNEILDEAERNSSCRVVILEGQNGFFCTGMDFEEVVSEDATEGRESLTNLYLKTIQRFTLIPKVIISKVDGLVMAGGVGLAAASDLVVATPRSQFSLSEALWGLLPAMVIPYLVRRVGFQKAYRMTLTTLPVSAQDAFSAGLADEISETPDESIKHWYNRLALLEESSIKNIKEYFGKMWIINEQTNELAVSESLRLITDPKVKENIYNFIKYQKFPWEKQKNE
jgi:polyketide biosynthesis enoyl-CoA hydratase PksH